MQGNGGTWKVVGIPFFVAFFGPKGFDYVGPLSMMAALGNAIFWFLVPEIPVAIVARRKRKNCGA
jgi:hypothetical protein